MTRELLDNSRDLRIHVQAWDASQVALCESLLRVAPYVSDLTPIIEGLLERAKAGSPWVKEASAHEDR